jgi:hypothetical protein
LSKDDVTYAVNHYGFLPEGFKFGLGPFAIKPILEPSFLSPGDPGYDSIDEDEIVNIECQWLDLQKYLRII